MDTHTIFYKVSTHRWLTIRLQKSQVGTQLVLTSWVIFIYARICTWHKLVDNTIETGRTTLWHNRAIVQSLTKINNNNNKKKKKKKKDITFYSLEGSLNFHNCYPCQKNGLHCHQFCLKCHSRRTTSIASHTIDD